MRWVAVPGGNGIHLLGILPGSGLKKVENMVDFWSAWLLDTIAHHADHRKPFFVEKKTAG